MSIIFPKILAISFILAAVFTLIITYSIGSNSRKGIMWVAFAICVLLAGYGFINGLLVFSVVSGLE